MYKFNDDRKPDWLIKREQESRLQQPLGTAGHYWHKNSKLFAYALACIQMVLRYGKAEAEYLQAKDSWGLSGCQSAIQNIKTGYLNKTITNQDTLLLIGDEGVDQNDLDTLHSNLGKFITGGFNRDIDIENGQLKIHPDPESLLYTVLELWTLADHLGIHLENFNKYQPYTRGERSYNTEEIMATKPTAGEARVIYRELTKIFKRECGIIHDNKLLKYADLWYHYRVDPGTLDACLDKSIEYDLDPERSNIMNAIEPYNEATGYPPKWYR